MSLTLELSPEAERILNREASAAGVPPLVYAERLLYRGLNLPDERARQSDSLAELFAAWEAEDAKRNLTAEEARAEDADWDEILTNIERNRLRFPVPNEANDEQELTGREVSYCLNDPGRVRLGN